MPNVRIRRSYDALTGPEKAAIMLLTLGEDRAAPLLERMEESEVRIISRSMAALGSITAECLEDLITRFTELFARGGSVIGSADVAERMLRSFLPAEKVSDIMNYIKGPNASSTWEKMSMVSDTLLAKYLSGEHPQTIAVVLSKIAPDQASNVLKDLPPGLVTDVLQRMISMKSVPEEVLRDMEDMLQRDLMLNYTVANDSNNFEHLAEIFNRTDTERCEQMLSQLRTGHDEEVDQIKQLMFTFEDLLELDEQSLRTVVRSCDSDTLIYALKGCTQDVREKIASNLSERAQSILFDNMDALGPVPTRDVESAKAAMVRKAKELDEENVIVIDRGNGAARMVY
jgi:flagellar motor switch protein FliG